MSTFFPQTNAISFRYQRQFHNLGDHKISNLKSNKQHFIIRKPWWLKIKLEILELYISEIQHTSQITKSKICLLSQVISYYNFCIISDVRTPLLQCTQTYLNLESHLQKTVIQSTTWICSVKTEKSGGHPRKKKRKVMFYLLSVSLSCW